MKIYIIRAVSFVLSILTAVMIYSFSADTAEESGELSSNITEQVLSTIGIDKETTPPAEYEEVKMKTEFSIRKLAHFSEYALLGACVFIFFATFRKRRWMTILFTLTVCVPYAVFDEWHQAFVPGRGPGIKDVLIDSAGSLCGAVFVLLVIQVGLYIDKKKRKTLPRGRS